jgi:hypothetical protein
MLTGLRDLCEVARPRAGHVDETRSAGGIRVLSDQAEDPPLLGSV